MINKPLIDNYEQLLEANGYKHCTIDNVFYVYRMLPKTMSMFTQEDWKYYWGVSYWNWRYTN